MLCVCAFLIGICAHAYAGDPGSSCADAIPLGKEYSHDVQKGQSIWYLARTFDLPLTVTFAPENGKNDPDPEVMLDFTCTPGYYEDSILCSLFCQTSMGTVQYDMPHKPKLDTMTLKNGTFVYYLSLGKTYRDLLLQMGISYNVDVYVNVTYKSNGTIAMSPDAMFSNCMDGAPFMHIGDVVQVEAKDKQHHVLIPYVQWQEDTIIYKWTGTTPCTLAVANTCNFDPTDNSDENIIQFTEEPIQPGDSLKVKAENIYKWVHNKEFKNEAGMYFAKFYTEEPGEMKITKAQQAPPRGKATLLRFDRTYALNANETALFAIPNSWNDDTLNTQFKTPTEHIFRMSIATDPDFSEEHTLKSYQFEKTSYGRWQGIKADSMVKFWKKTKEQYLYIRFDCSEATTITPSIWSVSDCETKAPNYIHSLDTTFVVARNSTEGFYKLNYAQWIGGDLTLTFTPAKKCQIYFATDCDVTQGTTIDVAPNLLYYKQLTQSNNRVTITKEEIASWSERVSGDGYIYARFHHTLAGTYKMKVHSEAPEDADPTYPASSIAVACDEHNQVYVIVKQKQTIIIKNEAGVEVKTIPDAQPETKYSLAELPAGRYALQAESETIEIQL